MLDIKFIRENPKIVKKACKDRGYDVDVDELLKLDEQYRDSLQKVEKLKHQRNTATQEINELKKAGKPIASKIKEIKEIPDKINKLEEDIKKLREKMFDIASAMPNLPDPAVPVGQDESKNQEVKKKGALPKFSFEPKPHWEIGKNLDIIDIDASIKLSGHGFYVFKGLGARLERALINFFLDYHTKDGYVELFPPFLVNKETMFGTSQLPKFEQDLYKTTDGMYLIPTAEVPLTNMHRDETLDFKELPKYYCAYTPCFRTEAGRHGTETRGIFRLHQFDKVEMVKISLPEHSDKELEDMRQRAEKLLELLGIPYKTMLLCSGEMSFAASKAYDIEVWSPYQKKYLEVSSCSNCKDFQARRMNTKFRTPDGNKFVHTLNGSGLALPRLMISLLECNQLKDGSVKIPKVIQPYMGGITKIEAKKLL
jgi:seryl-tRNA synthetase